MSPLHKRMLCDKFRWNWLGGSGKEDFRNYFPLEKGVVLHMNKHESPLPNEALCQVWLKLARWFWKRRFLNIFNRNLLPFIAIISPFCSLSMLWYNHSFEQMSLTILRLAIWPTNLLFLVLHPILRYCNIADSSVNNLS